MFYDLFSRERLDSTISGWGIYLKHISSNIVKHNLSDLLILGLFSSIQLFDTINRYEDIRSHPFYRELLDLKDYGLVWYFFKFIISIYGKYCSNGKINPSQSIMKRNMVRFGQNDQYDIMHDHKVFDYLRIIDKIKIGKDSPLVSKIFVQEDKILLTWISDREDMDDLWERCIGLKDHGQDHDSSKFTTTWYKKSYVNLIRSLERKVNRGYDFTPVGQNIVNIILSYARLGYHCIDSVTFHKFNNKVGFENLKNSITVGIILNYLVFKAKLGIDTNGFNYGLLLRKVNDTRGSDRESEFFKTLNGSFKGSFDPKEVYRYVRETYENLQSYIELIDICTDYYLKLGLILKDYPDRFQGVNGNDLERVMCSLNVNRWYLKYLYNNKSIELKSLDFDQLESSIVEDRILSDLENGKIKGNWIESREIQVIRFHKYVPVNSILIGFKDKVNLPLEDIMHLDLPGLSSFRYLDNRLRNPGTNETIFRYHEGIGKCKDLVDLLYDQYMIHCLTRFICNEEPRIDDDILASLTASTTGQSYGIRTMWDNGIDKNFRSIMTKNHEFIKKSLEEKVELSNDNDRERCSMELKEYLTFLSNPKLHQDNIANKGLAEEGISREEYVEFLGNRYMLNAGYLCLDKYRFFSLFDRYTSIKDCWIMIDSYRYHSHVQLVEAFELAKFSCEEYPYKDEKEYGKMNRMIMSMYDNTKAFYLSQDYVKESTEIIIDSYNDLSKINKMNKKYWVGTHDRININRTEFNSENHWGLLDPSTGSYRESDKDGSRLVKILRDHEFLNQFLKKCQDKLIKSLAFVILRYSTMAHVCYVAGRFTTNNLKVNRYVFGRTEYYPDPFGIVSMDDKHSESGNGIELMSDQDRFSINGTIEQYQSYMVQRLSQEGLYSRVDRLPDLSIRSENPNEGSPNRCDDGCEQFLNIKAPIEYYTF